MPVTHLQTIGDAGPLADAAVAAARKFRKLTLSARAYDGLTGLGEGDWVYLARPSSGEATLTHDADVSAVAGAIPFAHDNGADRVIDERSPALMLFVVHNGKLRPSGGGATNSETVANLATLTALASPATDTAYYVDSVGRSYAWRTDRTGVHGPSTVTRGSGYSGTKGAVFGSVPITDVGGSGTGALATVVMGGAEVAYAEITAFGSGYSGTPTVTNASMVAAGATGLTGASIVYGLNAQGMVSHDTLTTGRFVTIDAESRFATYGQQIDDNTAIKALHIANNSTDDAYTLRIRKGPVLGVGTRPVMGSRYGYSSNSIALYYDVMDDVSSLPFYTSALDVIVSGANGKGNGVVGTAIYATRETSSDGHAGGSNGLAPVGVALGEVLPLVTFARTRGAGAAFGAAFHTVSSDTNGANLRGVEIDAIVETGVTAVSKFGIQLVCPDPDRGAVTGVIPIQMSDGSSAARASVDADAETINVSLDPTVTDNQLSLISRQNAAIDFVGVGGNYGFEYALRTARFYGNNPAIRTSGSLWQAAGFSVDKGLDWRHMLPFGTSAIDLPNNSPIRAMTSTFAMANLLKINTSDVAEIAGSLRINTNTGAAVYLGDFDVLNAFRIYDSGGDHRLRLHPTENLTDDRTVSIHIGDADRILDLSALRAAQGAGYTTLRDVSNHLFLTSGPSGDPTTALDNTIHQFRTRNAAQVLAEISNSAVNDETALMIMVDRGGTETLSRVTIGATDSAGTGFRALRIAN